METEPETKLTAAQILLARNEGYHKLTRTSKHNLVVAFARKGKPLYGKAFDIVKCNKSIDLTNEQSIIDNLDDIIICEIKSTKKNMRERNIGPDFTNYFFGLTTAELLVAQSLKEQYRFIFVNIDTRAIVEMTLKEVLAKARTIYPQWSIRF